MCWLGCAAMSGSRVNYLDSSAIVKLVVAAPESAALRRYLRRRTRCASSALAQTEVARAVLHLGPEAERLARDALRRIDLSRINDRVLVGAGALLPAELRSLDAIHLATAQLLGDSLIRIITYDERMADAAHHLNLTVVTPK
jgi:predicted nucleic acid-binding protein